MMSMETMKTQQFSTREYDKGHRERPWNNNKKLKTEGLSFSDVSPKRSDELVSLIKKMNEENSTSGHTEMSMYEFPEIEGMRV